MARAAGRDEAGRVPCGTPQAAEDVAQRILDEKGASTRGWEVRVSRLCPRSTVQLTAGRRSRKQGTSRTHSTLCAQFRVFELERANATEESLRRAFRRCGDGCDGWVPCETLTHVSVRAGNAGWRSLCTPTSAATLYRARRLSLFETCVTAITSHVSEASP